jgi:beta-glucosidase
VPPQTTSISRPKKELKGFKKVFLLPGERKQVEVGFDKRTLAFWDEVLEEWVIESGTYGVLVGGGSEEGDIRLRGELRVEEGWTWSGL